MGLLADGLVAGAVAGVVSGLPSTVWSSVVDRDPLQATRAAGSILIGTERRPTALVLAAIPVHVFLSAFWGIVLTTLLPRRGTRLWGALAGLLIAGVDLGVIGQRFPMVRALPTFTQVADHLLFGWTVGAVIDSRSG